MTEGWTFHAILRQTHIVLGAVGLAAFWVPIFAKKGGVLHRKAGQLFAWCAYAVTVSALVSSVWAMLDPAGWIGRPDLPPEVVARLEAQVRPFLSILGLLAAVTLLSVRMGVRAVRTRRDPAAFASAELYALLGLVVLAAVGLVGMNGVRLAQQGAQGMTVVGLALGLAGLNEARMSLRVLRRPRPTPMSWWYTHMECMLGAGIAFHTAVLVFGAGRYFEGWLPGPLALLPWLLPTAIGVPATSLWIRHYRRKFGEEQPLSEAASLAAMAGRGR
jgi:hypothetical protein